MSEPIPTTAPDAPEAQVEAPAALDAEPKTFDADYVAKLRHEAAKYRTEAKANADAAKRLAEIEEATKSNEQKLADRLAAAEKRAADAERTAFAATKGVPASLIHGSTPEEWETSAAEALAWKGVVTPPPPAAPSANGQGNVGTPIGGTDVDRIAQQIAAATKDGRHAEAIHLKRQLSALNNKTN